MQTGSTGTLIGWKSGQTTYVLYETEWRERGYGLWNRFPAFKYSISEQAPIRVSSKQTKNIFGLNQKEPKLNLFRLLFGLFTKSNFFSVCLSRSRCFEHVSKQPKQTCRFRNKPKNNSEKYTSRYSVGWTLVS